MLQRQYRADIDGLRAAAVLAVLLYHFDFKAFSGGFTGVDIFFVISGFLITQNIMADLSGGTFSFARFYARRVKRLFPALYATLLLSLLASHLLFTPEHHLQFGKSLLASLLSVSNILFWKEAGYFDTAADFKPLLHTWSLAVEEQFYFIWPAMLLLLAKLGKKWLLAALLLGSAASLYCAERWLRSDPSGAFFLTPFRLAEFACGAALVWLPAPRRKWLAELALAAGLLDISWGIFRFSKQTPFPGLHSLVPSLGAALIIWSGQAPLLGWLLRNRLAVGIGLISYSLYLVHWPLLIFYKYWKYSELTLHERQSLLLLCFILAGLSWRFIEQPFRRGRLLAQRTFFALCGLTAVLLLAAGTELIRQEGFLSRISSTFAKAQNAAQFHVEQFGGKGYSFTGTLGVNKPDYDLIITGDSFVLQYAAGLDQLFQQHGLSAKLATDYACIIGPDITFLYKGQPDEACSTQSRRFFKLAEGNSKPVILSLAWEWYPEGICDLNGRQIKFADHRAFEDFMIGNLEKIRAKIGRDRPFLIIGNPPGSGNRNGIISCLNRPNFLPNNCLGKMVFPRAQGVGLAINQRLRDYAADPNVWFFDPFDVFCGKESCAALDARQNVIWYSDGGHLSIDGSRKAAEVFGPELLRVLRPAVR
ncbi:MAG: acyltransferase family protein [Candidatus Electronema sp. V4]|uniref:acyltransferase family protein n=1 Tax=Candidatus Electronema sp. V4 TaxID=3454756 RepID=UPI00405596C8